MKVLKFGGTSVGSAERIKNVAELLQNETKVIVVLSAVSGTTNALVKYADNLSKGLKMDALDLLADLEGQYELLVKDLYLTDEFLKKGKQLVRSHFEYLQAFAQDVFTIFEEKAVLAQGELISSALFYLYMIENGVKVSLLPALNFMRINQDEEPQMDYLRDNIQVLMKGKFADIWITQGYICRNDFGEIDNLKRGGSDYTATLIGAALEVDEVQIWTDIDGMHNNDPRFVDNTFPVAKMSYNEAAELAYFGAKILHPSCIWPVQQKKVKVWLKNTLQPQAAGTLIADNSVRNTFTAVAAKDGITAIKIRSGRMMNAYGFLRAVFEVFERYKTPIDMITTSEVAVSLTIDNAQHITAIREELLKFGEVEIDDQHAIVCVVGDFLWESKGSATKIFNGLLDIPVRMISYGGSKNNVSILVKEGDKERTLQALQLELFAIPEYDKR